MDFKKITEEKKLSVLSFLFFFMSCTEAPKKIDRVSVGKKYQTNKTKIEVII